jgi:F-type H+-transporting ATPase subunit b
MTARGSSLVRTAGPAALLVAVLVTPSVTLAVAEGLEGEAAHGPSWTLTLLGFANFGIYCYILWRFAWPPIVKYLKDRRAQVVGALEAAARAHAEAEELKAEFQAKLATVEADAARARDELMEIARNEADRLLEQAQRSADRIRRDAQLVAHQEIARARRVLQDEAAQLIAGIAGQLVAKQLTPDDQSRFIKDFLAETRAAGQDGLAGLDGASRAAR